MQRPQSKTQAEVIKDFRARATGARMAASVSDCKTGSPAHIKLMAIAQTWDDAALILSQTMLRKETP